jgi:hypothetical protein
VLFVWGSISHMALPLGQAGVRVIPPSLDTTSSKSSTTADGALDMLFAQNIPRIQGDTLRHISALTALTVDGKVQDSPPPAGRIYAPVRNPHYNDSNYRAHVSLPGWR